MCAGVLVQDPESHLKEIGVHPPSMFKGGGKPVIDSSLRARLNYEIYYFANRAELDRFQKDPLRYCGSLTDPVTMARFRPTPKSPRTDYADRAYYFASDSTKAAFLKDPMQYKDRKTGTH